ncbi:MULTISPECIES: AMP-binding protein [Halomonas]|uniref:AMP-binding protein n=1 Tax=Halomonas TaxID=2745 RepID=UPI001C94788F|nr:MULTISPECIES: AMP-binding protein [Halomonas]MBY6207987.1 AMP-binding protein [Halomonas sp. DP3Y7-2]MBY6228796.1 AMP-binding protein [Halomonas sp. DP3Y7-1]MCA0917220.1 AMP-binding protein [Halomonas denitrificans]
MSHATLPSAESYRETFDIQQVIDRLDDHGDGCLNAYYACCGRHVAQGRGEVLALVHEAPDGAVTRLSYRELDSLSARLAAWMSAQGLAAGDRIACMLPRSPQLLIAVLASWRLGAVYQPLFTAFGPDAVDYRLGRADTKLVITDGANRHKFDGLASCPSVLALGGASEAHPQDLDWDHALSSEPSSATPPRLGPEQPFLQMFTSGTVGKPKGVAVPLSAMPAFALYMELAVELRGEDRFWNMADPGWAYGLYYAITGPLLLGVTTHFCEAGFSAEGALAFMQRHDITNFAAAPTAYRLMKASGLFDQAHETLSLRAASSAGEPLNTEVVNWVERALGCAVMDHYGQTETGMTCNNHHCLDHPKHVGGMGVPMPGYRLVILDAEYNELPPGEPGVLAVDVARSPAHFFPGYTWQEKHPFAEGYYLTGDVVIRNDDGSFQFAGRDDDIITTAGYRVGPTDVENSVLTHPAVAESAAVGQPDDIRGEIIKSYVVLREGFEASDELAEDIRQQVRERLSTHAFPRVIEFVDELPKTPSGKIQRFKLRADAAAKA